MKVVTIKKVSTGSIYKLFCIGSLLGIIPLCLIAGIFGALGMEAVSWNNQPVTGLKALIVGPLIGVLMAMLFTVLWGTVVAFGLWIYSFLKPITISYSTSDKC